VAAVSIRDLDDDVKERLRIRAARNGRSMEAEIRAILAEAVSDPRPAQDLFTSLLDRVGPAAGADLDIPPRAHRARAADLTA
jgi:antitoxin FitA